MPWHVLICTSALMLLLQTNVNCRKRDDKLVHYRRTSLHNKIPDNVVHFIKYSHLARPRSLSKNQMNQRLIGQPILIENRDGQNLPPSQQYGKLQTLVKMLKAIVYDQELKKSKEKSSEQVKRLINPSEFRKPSASFYQGRSSSHHNSLFNKKKQERYEDILKPVKNDRLTTPPSQLQNGTSQEQKDKLSPKFRAFLVPKPQNTTIKFKNKKVSHAKETNLKQQEDISSKPLENAGRCMSNHKLKSQTSKFQNSMGNNEKAEDMHNLKTGYNTNSQFHNSHSQSYHVSNSNLNLKNSKSVNDFIPHSNSHNPPLKKNFNVKVLNPQLDSNFNPKAKVHYDITAKENLNLDFDNIDNTTPGNWDSSQSHSKNNHNIATGHHANSKIDDTHSPQLQSKYIEIGNTKKGDEKNSNAIYKNSNAQSKNHGNAETTNHYQSGSNISTVGDYVICEKAHSPQMKFKENHKHIPEDNHNTDFKNEDHELKNTTNVETKNYKDLDSTSDNTYSLSLHNNPQFKDIYNVKIEKDDDSNNSDVSNSNISDYITAGNAKYSKFPAKSFSTKSKIGDANLNNRNTKLGQKYDSGGSTNNDVLRSNIRNYKTVENADFSTFPKKSFHTKSKIGGAKLNNQNTKLRHDNYHSSGSNNDDVSSSNKSDSKTAGKVDSSKLQLKNNNKFIPENSFPTKTKIDDGKLNNHNTKLGHDNYNSGGSNNSDISNSNISDSKTAGNVDSPKLQLEDNQSFPTKSKIGDAKLNHQNTKLGQDNYDSGGSKKSNDSSSNISDYKTAGNVDSSKLQLNNNHKFIPEKRNHTKTKIGDPKLNNQNTKIGHDNYYSGGTNKSEISSSKISDYKTAGNVDSSKSQLKDNHKFIPENSVPIKSEIDDKKLNNHNTKLGHDNYDPGGSNNSDVSNFNKSDSKTAGNVNSSKLELKDNYKLIPEKGFPTKSNIGDVKLNNLNTKLGHGKYDSDGSNNSDVSSYNISDYKTHENSDSSKLQLKNNHKFIPENSFPTKTKIDDGKLNNHSTKLGHDNYDSGGSNNSDISNSNVSDSKIAGNVASPKLQLEDNQSFPTKSKIGDANLNIHNTKLGHDNYDSGGSNISNASNSNISDSKTAGNVDSPKLQLDKNQSFPIKSKIGDTNLNIHNTKLEQNNYNSGSNNTDKSIPENSYSLQLQSKNNSKPISESDYNTNPKNNNLQSGNQRNGTINESYTNSSFDKNYDGVLKNVNFLQIPFNDHYNPYIFKDKEGKSDNNYILNLDNSDGTIFNNQSKTDSNTTIPYKGYETEFQNKNLLTVKIYRIKILKGYDFNNYHKLFPEKILSLQLLPTDNHNSVYADASPKNGKTQSNNIYFSKMSDNYHFDPDIDTNLHSRKGYLSQSHNTISEGGYSAKLKNRVTPKNILKLDIHNFDDSIAAKLWLSHANLKKGNLKKGHGTKLKHIKPQLENMYIDRINQNSDPGNTDNFIHKDAYSSLSRNGYNHNLVSQYDYTTAPKNKYNKHYA